MAITTIEINTMEELFQFVSDHPFERKISRNRDLYLYRGLPDTNYSLLPSLTRICKGERARLELSILDNFAKYAELKDASIKDSVWRKMILGQHHGLPTRLLDWSKSPLVALHFAMTEGDMDNLDKRDCVVWRIDAEKIHDKLPSQYREKTAQTEQRIFTVDMIDDVCQDLDQYDHDMGSSNMVILEPPSMDERMMNQYSFFSVVPNGVNCVEEVLTCHEDAVVRYVINKNLRWEIRDFLDMSNINERIIYPGLDGIATWLSRHYFVRNASRLHIEKSNLVTMDVDMIVNASSRDLVPRGSVALNIFNGAGYEEMTNACQQIKFCQVGNIAITEGFALKASHVIHAVGPKFQEDHEIKGDLLLANVYEKSLQALIEHNKHSIAFPMLSAGNRGYPKELTLKIGLKTCKEFIEKNPGYPLDITFCVLSEVDYILAQKIYSEIMGISYQAEDILTARDYRRGRNYNYRR